MLGSLVICCVDTYHYFSKFSYCDSLLSGDRHNLYCLWISRLMSTLFLQVKSCILPGVVVLYYLESFGTEPYCVDIETIIAPFFHVDFKAAVTGAMEALFQDDEEQDIDKSGDVYLKKQQQRHFAYENDESDPTSISQSELEGCVSLLSCENVSSDSTIASTIRGSKRAAQLLRESNPVSQYVEMACRVSANAHTIPLLEAYVDTALSDAPRGANRVSEGTGTSQDNRCADASVQSVVFGLFPTTARLNHDCRPNCLYSFYPSLYRNIQEKVISSDTSHNDGGLFSHPGSSSTLPLCSALPLLAMQVLYTNSAPAPAPAPAPDLYYTCV